MNLFENLQQLKEFDKNVKISNKNYKRTLKEIINVISSVYEKELIPKQCNEIIEDIYYKVIELKEMFDEDVKTEAPKEFFNKMTKAKETLSHFSTSQVDFVKKAYDEVLADIGDAFVSERGDNSSKIKNEWKSVAVENGTVTEEEFDTIYSALEVIGVFYSQAHA